MAAKTPHPPRPQDPGRDADRSQVDIAQEALHRKRMADEEAKKKTPHFEEPTPSEGMHSDPNEDQAPSGALDHGGHKPAMQRSRFARR